jgi:LmbE family N-acetylglucosaminyl deacetylase/protein-L-isoaspartate O-methyltransferase
VSVVFSHLDPGTPETVWNADPRLAVLPVLDADIDDLLVVAAHPDDETLGASGLVQRVSAAGGRVVVIIATDGEGSHPESPTHSRNQLAVRRRAEVTDAIRLLAPDAAIFFLGLADGMLRENVDILETALADILDTRGIAATRRGTRSARAERSLVLAPWSGDGHRDHRIVAETVGRLCETRGLTHRGYPIWAWHWAEPDDLPWDRMRSLRLSELETETKARAIGLHVSQLAPLSSAPGDEPVLHPGMRAHFERDVEVFIDESPAEVMSLPAGWFEAFYSRNDDPWGFESRWYERRKRDVLLAALPDPHLGRVLEIGCSSGLITFRLRGRADSVVALDPVPAALDAARARIGHDDRVAFVCGHVPTDWPSGEFDTIVLSEVLYYLSTADLERTLDLAESALSDQGTLVACHWRHAVQGYPQTGDAVQDAVRERRAWTALARHEEKDFLLEIFTRPPARSVAEREGLV